MDTRFALLLSCFFLSGFAALLYQTVWSRELSFVFGTSDLAIAAVLAAYMGGLALGAAAAARLASRVRRPVLAYGVLEMAIAVCALLVPSAIRGLDALYVALLGGGEVLSSGVPAAATLFQLASSFAVLLPPTAFMGATLPLLTRHAVHREDEISTRVGVLYAVNTVGAIAGTVCAAFWLMPELGLRRTVWVGAGLNLAVFGLAALLARGAPLARDTSDARRRAATTSGGFWVLPAIAVSGAVSFSYEVLWTRLLGFLLGSSVQAFATMLASFLLGIAIGSAIAARLGRSRERASLGFVIAQLGIALTSYAVFALSGRLSHLAGGLGAGPTAPLASAAVAAAALLPITLCIGATFPFAVRVLAGRPEQATRATARVYAWNTMGAIAGALGAGFVLLPALGFEGTLTVGVAISLGLAAAGCLAGSPTRIPLLGAAALGAVLLAVIPPRTPWRLLTASMLGQRLDERRDILFSAVGRSATVLVSEWSGVYRLSTNGLPEASIESVGTVPQNSIEHWLAALPAWVRPEGRELLVVGLGGGQALEFVPRSYRSIDVIELEPQVIAANETIAALRERDPLADRRVRIHVGDARGTLQLTRRRFDAIVSQPSHPWTAGASNLYTREFFALVRSRLAPDGVFVQWIGGSFVDESLLKSLLAALNEVFPHVVVFAPEVHGLLFVASGAPIDPLAGAAPTLREAPDELALFGIATLEEFASRWLLGEDGVRALADGAQPNTDDRNQLAARSASLAKALDPDSIQGLTSPHDPLRAAPGLDFCATIRALLASGQGPRAAELVKASTGATQEIGLGWIELEKGRSGRAARHFARALELAPDHPEVRAGLIASRKDALARGENLPSVSDTELDARQRALVAGWRHAKRGSWDAVAELDAQLARFAPGEPLFDLATQLRIEQRLESDRPEAAAEAQALARKLLVRRWVPKVGLLHARAALRAEDSVAAWASLQTLARVASTAPLARSQRGRDLAQRVLELGRALPDERYAELEALLVKPKENPKRDASES